MVNERIYLALKNSTSQEIDSEPESWWNWWTGYNELYPYDEKPSINFESEQYELKPLTPCSCFHAGTLVWTATGPIAIEKVQRGDRVLSQDPVTGELDYQMVLATTVRPPNPSLNIKLGNDEIVATLGHPMWVVGGGWKMAKELSVGDMLHSIQGGVAIEHIEPGTEAEAYNLVVQGTNTYFVGRNRLLVHDNMPRKVTKAPVPGWLVAKQ